MRLDAPSEALGAQAERVIGVYEKCPRRAIKRQMPGRLVLLPPHVQQSFVRLSGLEVERTDFVLRRLLTAAKSSEVSAD